MSVKPIIFSAPMVRAIRDGRKSVTRRVVKLQPDAPEDLRILREPGYAPRNPGDVLWVREAWARYLDYTSGKPVWQYAHRADGEKRRVAARDANGRGFGIPLEWRPSMFMPKAAARLFLTVEDVRLERLRDITDDEAEREGFTEAALKDNEIDLQILGPFSGGGIFKPRFVFALYWDSLRKSADLAEYGWNVNPWVGRIAFRQCEKPEGWPES